MEIEPHHIDDEVQRQRSFKRQATSIFSMAHDLYDEFGAHIAVIPFSPDGEPHAYGAPTAESVLRTYLPVATAAPPPPCAEVVGEAAVCVARMEKEVEDTKSLVEVESGVSVACGKIMAAQRSAGLQNWWEVDVEALGEEELPVFSRALEVLWAQVQRRIDEMASSRAMLPSEEKQQ